MHSRQKFSGLQQSAFAAGQERNQLMVLPIVERMTQGSDPVTLGRTLRIPVDWKGVEV
jgi:hypothetical protein